jgi:ABC-type branched-subunit amino acid transport system substrate-binding protein
LELRNFSFRELLNTSIANGITGNIEFNEEGDRVESLYEIINVQPEQLKVVGIYRTNTVSESDVLLNLWS